MSAASTQLLALVAAKKATLRSITEVTRENVEWTLPSGAYYLTARGTLVGTDVLDPAFLFRYRFSTPLESEAGRMLWQSYQRLRSAFAGRLPALDDPRLMGVIMSESLLRLADTQSDVKVVREINGLANSLIDLTLGITPVVGDAVGLYEGMHGSTVTGQPLTSAERTFALMGVLAGNRSLWQGASVQLSGIVRELIESVRRVTGRPIQRIAGASLAEAEIILKVADRYRGRAGRLGDQFAGANRLPDLVGNYREAFEGTIFKGVYEPGEVLFQVQRAGQPNPGRWFSPVRPINSQHADELLNTRKWNNYGEVLKVFVVRERIAGYAGKIAGGEGHQFFIPETISSGRVPLAEILEEVQP